MGSQRPINREAVRPRQRFGNGQWMPMLFAAAPPPPPPTKPEIVYSRVVSTALVLAIFFMCWYSYELFGLVECTNVSVSILDIFDANFTASSIHMACHLMWVSQQLDNRPPPPPITDATAKPYWAMCMWRLYTKFIIIAHSIVLLVAWTCVVPFLAVLHEATQWRTWVYSMFL